MADNKRWFKVWTTVLNDPHLFSMPLDDVARWFLLGALTAEQGTSGKITISKKQLNILFRNDNENDNKNSLNNMPNLEYQNDNDTISVSFIKWAKYQVDSTAYERLKKHRKKQNDNGVRREEKRREEKKNNIPISFTRLWEEYPNKKDKQTALKSYQKINPSEELVERISTFIVSAKKSIEWTKDNGQYIPMFSTFLNNQRWEDVLTFRPKAWDE